MLAAEELAPEKTRSRLSRASTIAAAGSGVLQLASLLTFALVSHALAPADVGGYRQILILQSLAMIAGALGMQTAMLYRVGRATSDTEVADIYRATLTWMIAGTAVSGTLTGVLVYGAGRYLHSDVLLQNTGMAAFAAAANSYALFVAPVLLSRSRARVYLAFAVAQTLVVYAATWVLVHRDPHLRSALLALAATGIVAWLGTVLYLASLSRGAGGDLLRTIRENQRYGLPIALSAGTYALSYQMDHFVATRLLPSALYPEYAAGAWQVPVGPLVQRAQSDVFLPRMSGHHSGGRTKEFWSEWQSAITPWTVLGAAMFWLMFPMADDILRVVMGQAYAPAAVVLRIYAVLLPLRMAAFALPLRAAGYPLLDLAASAAFGVVNLSVGWVLTPRLGLAGPAIGVVAGYITWIGINVAFTTRILGASVRAVVPARSTLIALSAGAAAAAPAWLVARMASSESGVVHLIAYCTTYIAGMGVAFVVLRRNTWQVPHEAV